MQINDRGFRSIFWEYLVVAALSGFVGAIYCLICLWMGWEP